MSSFPVGASLLATVRNAAAASLAVRQRHAPGAARPHPGSRRLRRSSAVGLLVLGSLLLAPCSFAAELTDLGQGLAYLRVASLADSARTITAVVPEPRALVLDLRYVTADEESGARLREALAPRPARSPLFVLVSPATPPAVAAALANLPGNVLLLGPAGSVPAATVVVRQTAEADRRAYDAATGGASLLSLVSGRIGKERYDEAALVREFANGHRDPAPPDLPDPTKLGDAPVDEDAPPVDRVLQRAIHLHRALLAIRTP